VRGKKILMKVSMLKIHLRMGHLSSAKFEVFTAVKIQVEIFRVVILLSVTVG